MAQKVAGAKTKKWEPGTGPGWTITPPTDDFQRRMNEMSIQDLRPSRVVAEAMEQRRRNQHFQAPGSDSARNPWGRNLTYEQAQVLFAPTELKNDPGPWEVKASNLGSPRNMSQWSAATGKNGYAIPDYEYHPGSDEKLMDQYGEKDFPPGVFVPAHLLAGLDPNFGQSGENGLFPGTIQDYGEYWTTDPEVRVWDTTAKGTQMDMIRRTRANFRGKQNLAEMGKISAKNPGIAAMDEKVRNRKIMQKFYEMYMPKNATNWGSF